MITLLNRFRILFAYLMFIFPNLIFSQDQSIHLKRGRLYTAEGFEMKMGMFSIRSKLTRMEEEEAKRYLSYCRLSKTNITFEGF
ncbi:MAG: hypothetical protein AB8H03_09580 [Saprospiraceae bacterium]